DLSLLKPDPAKVQAAVEAAVMSGYDPAVLKKDWKKFLVKRIVVAGAGGAARMREAARLGTIAGEANLFTRDLQNLPSNVIFPRALAARARKVAAASPRLRVKVLGRKGMEALKMGCLLGVAKGSSLEPQLVHLTYRPAGKARGRVALVGKGLCFDSGGISLKPSSKMDEMKFDMSGAAAVLGVFHGLGAGHPCPYEVHGVLGCAMNMPGGRAQVPGDVVKAMNGKTIEVLNTDAEGRLVLADALTYAVRKTRPDRIYDLATLTGAAIVALGHHATAILGNRAPLRESLQESGERVGERCWPLPLWEVHRKLTHGRYADLKNIYSPGDGAGTIAGAAFLSHFVEDCPWVHLDIAGTAWGGADDAYHGAGGRGVGVRLLLELLRT
ncbi:MAG: M17 family metallopeptidase, partial [Planctomycetota bacterium]